ncbi:MAG TPA: SUMF1/EgtB/PvdO family nonheme iron enzyme [Ktedonobacterales bacterium]
MSAANLTTGAQHDAPRIFVSHSHEDHAFCVRLIGDLRARFGEEAVWYDASGGQHGLTGGEAWWDEIVAEITARPYFLVVLSPNAVASRWVPQEMGIAFRQHVELGKRLLPVRLADAPRRADWAGLQEFHFEAPRPYEVALAELIQAIDPLLQTPRPAASVAAPTPPSPQQALLQRLTQEAHTAYGRERWSDAIDRTDVLIARSAMTPMLWRERASAALALGDVTAAAQAIDEALRTDPDDIETVRLQARILLRQGHAEQAVKALTLANTLAPMDDAVTRLPLLADLCDALAQAGQWDTALRRCGDALYLAPNDTAWLRRQRDALLKLNRDSDALTVAQALAARPDATAADHLTLAQLLKAQGAPLEAVRSTLDAASASSSDAALSQRIAQARRELLTPIPAERFPERLATLGYTPQAQGGHEWIIPPVCLVSAGQFRLGSDKHHDPQARDDELNRRVVTLPAFAIARFPVTVAEYACFLAATQRQEPHDWATQRRRLDHPVVSVSWFDAFDYAVWLAERTQQPWRLPTEAEWEKAARCDPRDPLGASSERIYPWGDRFDPARCNTSESGQRGTTPVGWYGPDNPDPRAGRQSGASPWGAEELAGNVWEWLATAYAADYSTSETTEPRDSTNNRCLRGGSWFNVAGLACAAYRLDLLPDYGGSYIGFRLVRASPGG